jgi:hypothetical protein
VFVIVEDSDYGQRPVGRDLYTDEAAALSELAEMNRDATSASVPVVFRLFALTEIVETFKETR